MANLATIFLQPVAHIYNTRTNNCRLGLFNVRRNKWTYLTKVSNYIQAESQMTCNGISNSPVFSACSQPKQVESNEPEKFQALISCKS